jgi:HPt (histidine-containing phosphotransfer) domain-containing protein
MTDAEDKTASLLAALWVRNRPVVEQRVAVLDRAALAAANGPLTEELRTEANSSAHKLAGALGMYGYDEGTQIARRLELMLSVTTPDAARLNELIVELRASIFPPERSS